MEHKTWNLYIEFEGHPMYTEFVDDSGDMDETEVVQYVLNNIIIEATEADY
jgi:hypothetical protein